LNWLKTEKKKSQEMAISSDNLLFKQHEQGSSYISFGRQFIFCIKYPFLSFIMREILVYLNVLNIIIVFFRNVNVNKQYRESCAFTRRITLYIYILSLYKHQLICHFVLRICGHLKMENILLQK
jgi:hypothetical protein